jgi:uncharacterized protein (TIGR00299 family) protein
MHNHCDMLALLLDPYCGASGDMILACLLDLGADLEIIEDTIESVGCKINLSQVKRGHLRGTKVDVLADGRYHSVDEARSILKGSKLEAPALDKALQIMDSLASAEATVHGIGRESAKFHEIGALDALADIAGCCAALYSLDVDRIISLPISVGGGTILASHGLLPVPSPATLEILRRSNLLWHGGPVNHELLTPTGASILANVVDQAIREYPGIRAEKVGYGAGTKEFEMPNLLRGVIGDLDHPHLVQDQIVQLETNMDDVTGEVLGNLIDLLMDNGALDVSIVPATMKKGRCGTIINVIATHADMESMANMLMKETGSLGVRVFPSIHRFVAKREISKITVEMHGEVFQSAIKISRLGEDILKVKAEYEDCRQIAAKTGIALREVIRRVEEEGWKKVA